MRVAIAYHSGYGHTERQAQAVAEGVNSVAGVEADLISVEDLVDTESPAWAQARSGRRHYFWLAHLYGIC